MEKVTRKFLIAGAGLITIYNVMKAVVKKTSELSSIDDESYSVGIYERRIKPTLDQMLSFGGIIFLLPVFAMISVAVYIDDPGPVIFTQKRIGKDKSFFYCHKFRSMKMSTPHDIPTHMMVDPESYITRVGRVLRKTSLDELPQIWDIFRGKMSVVGPRPALWNQDDLIYARSVYVDEDGNGVDVNSVMPGLTGLAQISGRDELEIDEKARVDGEYAVVLRSGGMRAFAMDFKCFFGTIKNVLIHDGVVEGGTGSMRRIEAPTAEEAGFEDYGHMKRFDIDQSLHKSVLIAGAGSYIGESFISYIAEHYPNIIVTTIDMIGDTWKENSFKDDSGRPYDSVFHVAGIAHSDIGSMSKQDQEKYYAINTDLAIECCKKSKEAGVHQFIFLSSMIIYGSKEYIDEKTVPQFANFYGNSKWLADKGVRALASKIDENIQGKEKEHGFNVAVLRLPMVYGKGSKGNYSALSKIAKKAPVFPNVENKRSMLYVGNLCEFVGQLILSGEGGVYFPQNREYSQTSELVRSIAEVHGKKMLMSRLLAAGVKLAEVMPIRKIKGLAEKAFGSSRYDQALSIYDGLDYQIYQLKESIILTED